MIQTSFNDQTQKLCKSTTLHLPAGSALVACRISFPFSLFIICIHVIKQQLCRPSQSKRRQHVELMWDEPSACREQLMASFKGTMT